MKQSPAAWRGVSGRVRTAGAAEPAQGDAHDESLVARARHEIAEHPAETVALVAMTIAIARLWMRRERAFTFRPDGSRRKRAVAPMALMAAICLLMMTGCVQDPARMAASSESERKGWGGIGADADPGQIADGQRIAQRECASCHSIDATSVSPIQSAPPLRDVLAMNDPDFLAYRFIDAMRIGHDEMPLFDFDIRSADALIAYIKSINGS